MAQIARAQVVGQSRAKGASAMSTKKFVSMATALAVTVVLLDAPLAEAHGRGHVTTASTRPTRLVDRHERRQRTQNKVTRVVKKKERAGKELVLHAKGSKTLHEARQGNPPIFATAPGSAFFKGRLNVPQDIKPRLTFLTPANSQLQKKLGPFVQKYWKKPYFWVALAGIGYVTVPELYYHRLLGCLEVEDYDGCVSLLSTAAIEEEDDAARVHYPMPPTASYRYSAEVANTAGENGTVRPVSGTACSLDRFVERKWNTAFVWVRIPETGNVTVPEDYYERFRGSLAGSPPNYQAECAVLVEAAAADMMTLEGAGSDTAYQQIN
jgi:hypothetical protein